MHTFDLGISWSIHYKKKCLSFSSSNITEFCILVGFHSWSSSVQFQLHVHYFANFFKNCQETKAFSSFLMLRCLLRLSFKTFVMSTMCFTCSWITMYAEESKLRFPPSVQPNVAGWLNMSWSSHVLPFTLPSWYCTVALLWLGESWLVGGNWHQTKVGRKLHILYRTP